VTDTSLRRLVGTARSELSPFQRQLLVVGILALHAAGIWGLLKLNAVRDAMQQVAPIFVSLVAPADPMPAPTPRTQEPKPKSKPAPAPARLIATPPTTVPAVEPFAVAAEPSTPANPTTMTVPAAPAADTAPAKASPQPPAPRLLPDSAVQFMQLPEVVYPRLSQRNAESGLVMVRAYVGATGGAPHSVHVEKSSGHARLDQAALAAVQKSRFKAYAEKGQPVEGWALVPIRFELEK
jgi:protein TonB